jgi:diaminohydroxyphosphoribosylaminopyrimidine deaminase / 5-amino-6-(5-phosphoribosylamino)uracil reductase
LRGAHLDLEAALRLLGDRGINEVQVEAGPALCGALLRAGLVDELLLYQAPVLLGDSARPLFAGLGIEAMDQRLRLKVVDEARIGDDHRLLLRPSTPRAR